MILKRNTMLKARIIAGFVALIALVICGVDIVRAIQHDIITVTGTTGNIEVKGNNVDGLTVTPALVFNETGDSITYEVILRSTNGVAFQIRNVTDDNTNAYITTSYDYDDTISAEEKPIRFTLTYTNYIPFGSNLDLEDIHITATVEEYDDGGEVQPGGSTDDADSPDVLVPNTGGGNTVVIETSSQKQSVLPQAIICIIALTTIIMVLPSSLRRRVSFGAISVVTFVFVSGGVLSLNASAEVQALGMTVVGNNISARPDTSDPQEVVSVTFPNIYNNKVTDRDGQAPGNAIILKTMDNKYALMDTGPSTANIRTVIYDSLKGLQGVDNVILDYLIISHLDGDHYGNANAFMNDPNITIKNIVFKHEIYSNDSKESVFRSLAQTAANNHINIITSGDEGAVGYLATLGVTDYTRLSEGMVINVGDYLKLDFYNTSSVYDGKTCATGLKLAWTASTTTSSLYRNAAGEYVYFDGSEYQFDDGGYDISSSRFPNSKVTFHTTTTPVQKEGGSGMNRYFYAYNGGNHNICASNPNAFGILAEVTTTGLNKYMYFPGDIENAGYSVLSSGANSAQLYSELNFNGSDFTNNTTPFAIPSEDDTATAIYNKLATDAAALGVPVNNLLDNIAIYQESHHGINNSEKALWKLNLNRSSGIYAIAETASNMINNNSFWLAKTYHYTLGNLPAENKLQVGTNTKDGVGCTINTNGVTSCAHY